MTTMRTLRERIRWCFENTEPKPTREEAAQRMGVSRGTVQLWLNGTTKTLTPDVYRAAAKFFRVARDWLETGDGDPRPKAIDSAGREPDAAYAMAIARAELAIKDPMKQIHRALKALHFEDAELEEVELLIRAKHDRLVAQEQLGKIMDQLNDLRRSPAKQPSDLNENHQDET